LLTSQDVKARDFKSVAVINHASFGWN